MNFRRGDSLLDMVSGIPVRVDSLAFGAYRKQFDQIRRLGARLHHATKSDTKKKLRTEILEHRLELTEAVLAEEMRKLKTQDAAIAAVLFGETTSEAEKRRRLAHEIDQVHQAQTKVGADRKELDKLAARPLDSGFWPKLRRLEGADFDSPFNFVWRLDFPAIFGGEQPGFDLLLGNPPFVTARNPVKRKLYHERWRRVCTQNYYWAVTRESAGKVV
jgi:hypothetical protein